MQAQMNFQVKKKTCKKIIFTYACVYVYIICYLRAPQLINKELSFQKALGSYTQY